MWHEIAGRLNRFADWRPALNLDLLAQVGAVGLVGLYSFLTHNYLSFGQGIRRWIRWP
jgi:hypothetical protein